MTPEPSGRPGREILVVAQPAAPGQKVRDRLGSLLAVGVAGSVGVPMAPRPGRRPHDQNVIQHDVPACLVVEELQLKPLAGELSERLFDRRSPLTTPRRAP